MPLYFAYGSNLDPVQLADREIDFANPRRAFAHNWRLAFNKIATLHAVPGEGRANIVPARRRGVEGVAFEIGRDAFANLDWYEGAKSGHYRRMTISLVLEDGAEAEADTYVATLTGTGLKPSPWYMQRILAGARHFDLGAEHIAMLEAWPTAGPAERPD